MEVVSPQRTTDKERHDGWLSVFTYPRITDRRGSAWRLFVPITPGCSSHEHSADQTATGKDLVERINAAATEIQTLKATVGITGVAARSSNCGFHLRISSLSVTTRKQDHP
jgi:hypothetical protein